MSNCEFCGCELGDENFVSVNNASVSSGMLDTHDVVLFACQKCWDEAWRKINAVDREHIKVKNEAYKGLICCANYVLAHENEDYEEYDGRPNKHIFYHAVMAMGLISPAEYGDERLQVLDQLKQYDRCVEWEEDDSDIYLLGPDDQARCPNCGFQFITEVEDE